ncbi:hypothetical protein N9X06_04945 [Paracoccaceae bacterium]|nr:hypothetical protein [Paracoccaceae bacterium]
MQKFMRLMVMLSVAACVTTTSDQMAIDGTRLSVKAETIGFEKKLIVSSNSDVCIGKYLAKASKAALQNSEGLDIDFKCESGVQRSGQLYLYGNKAAELIFVHSEGEVYKFPLVLGKTL